jgi:hypothetical protein
VKEAPIAKLFGRASGLDMAIEPVLHGWKAKVGYDKAGPFAAESELQQIESFTFQNRSDKVSTYGDIDITRDPTGPDSARKLRAAFNAIVDRLPSKKPPDPVFVVAKNIDAVKNPLG